MHTLLASATFTDVKPGLIVWTWITFAVVLFLLRKFAWGPLLQAVGDREKNIVNAIESAKRERAEAEKLADSVRQSLALLRRHL